MSGETLCKHGVNTSNPCPLCRLDKKMSTLDQWEAEASGGYGQIVKDDRILALIDLIRKKDEKLKSIIVPCDHKYSQECNGCISDEIIREALALTENLK